MCVDVQVEVTEVIALNPHDLDNSLSDVHINTFAEWRGQNQGRQVILSMLDFLQEIGFEMFDKCTGERAGILSEVQK